MNVINGYVSRSLAKSAIVTFFCNTAIRNGDKISTVPLIAGNFESENQFFIHQDYSRRTVFQLQNANLLHAGKETMKCATSSIYAQKYPH